MKLVGVPQDAAEAAELGSHADLLTMMMGVTSGPLLARTIQHALQRGVFEAMADGPKSSADIAKACRLGPTATRAMLEVFVATELVVHADERYRLSERGRRSLLGVGKRGENLIDTTLMGVLEWEWHKRFERFVRADETFNLHEQLTPPQWKIYQYAMTRAHPEMLEKFVDATPVPAGARRVLDLGGGSGIKALALLRRYPDLRAVILDLPPAVEVCAPLLREAAGEDNDRFEWRADDARSADLGDREYDVILSISFNYALTSEDNVNVVRRCARALRPGGFLVVGHGLIDPRPSESGEFHACMNMMVMFCARSVKWQPDTISGWQRDAGLEPLPMSEVIPGYGFFVARKPGA